MATDGNYVISKYPSTLCRSFPKLKRLLNLNKNEKQSLLYLNLIYFFLKGETPGPGAYRALSEFGYYEES